MKKTELKSDFPCVYSINGALHEDGEVNFDDDCVYYVTTLPLVAVYLPYTVKLVGTTPQTNRELCYSVDTPSKRFLLFTKRYNYVYSTTSFDGVRDGVCTFFQKVKDCDYKSAREKISPSLSSAVSDAKLSAFFEKYGSITKLCGNEYLLYDANGNGDIFCFSLKDGLVDDIYTK